MNSYYKIYITLVFIIVSAVSCSNRSSIYSSPPFLKDLESSGSIPQVEDRLPKNPYIQEVHESIGTYGGTWKYSWTGRDDKWGIAKLGEEFLLMLSPDGNGDVVLNLVEDFNISSDSKTFTFTLREGLKWSDGMPFTTSDIMFYWQHIMQNKDIYGKDVPRWILSPKDLSLPNITAKDDVTFTIKFNDANFLFIYSFITEGKEFFAPEHYYKTVFPEFIGASKAEDLAKKNGYDDFADFVNWEFKYWWVSPNVPSLRAWVASNSPNDKHFIMNRNPYYWKVDKEGKQLPYIDRIDITKVLDKDVIKARGFIGDLDFQSRHMSGFDELDKYKDSGNFKIISFNKLTEYGQAIQLNQTVENIFLRSLFNDVRFRKALSLSIDRKSIAGENHIISQFGPGTSDPYYNKELSEYLIDYDLEKANEYIDDIGLAPWDDQREYRLDNNGNPISIFIDVREGITEVDRAIARSLKLIGFKSEFRINSKAGFDDKLAENTLELATVSANPNDFVLDPSNIIPFRVKNPWAGLWSRYIETGGEDGIEPPEEFMNLIEIWGELASLNNLTEVKKLSDKIWENYKDNLWVIGFYNYSEKSYSVVSQRMHNVPSGLPSSDPLRSPGNARPCQFYME